MQSPFTSCWQAISSTAIHSLATKQVPSSQRTPCPRTCCVTMLLNYQVQHDCQQISKVQCERYQCGFNVHHMMWHPNADRKHIKCEHVLTLVQNYSKCVACALYSCAAHFTLASYCMSATALGRTWAITSCFCASHTIPVSLPLFGLGKMLSQHISGPYMMT